MRASLNAEPELVDSRKYLGPARDAFAAEVARLLSVLSGDGFAHADAEDCTLAYEHA